MVVIGKIPEKTRIQFLDTDSGTSKGITIQGMDFNKIFNNTKYFLEQLVTYSEIKLICYGGKEDGKNTAKRRREKDNREKSNETSEYDENIKTS